MMTGAELDEAFVVMARVLRKNLTPDQMRSFIERLRDTEAYAGNPPVFEVFVGKLLKEEEAQ
jgi:hypothetical protein